jgi:hypothetical protein
MVRFEDDRILELSSCPSEFSAEDPRMYRTPAVGYFGEVW